jgi:hypothetical protein
MRSWSYEQFSFVCLPDNELELFMPVKTIQEALTPHPRHYHRPKASHNTNGLPFHALPLQSKGGHWLARIFFGLIYLVQHNPTNRVLIWRRYYGLWLFLNGE